MTLTKYYEDNVRRRRERYNYREYKPGYNVEMGHRHHDFAARIRLRYMSICGQLQKINERRGDTSRTYRPLIMVQWEANLERLMAEASREEAFIRNAPRFTSGDFDGDFNGNWIERGRRGE